MLNLLPSSARHLPGLMMMLALTWVPRVSSLLRRDVLRRTLAGRDGETCSRDLRQSPHLGDEIPPRPLPSSRLCDLDLDLGTMWERWFFPRIANFFSGPNLPSSASHLPDVKLKSSPEAERRAMMYADVSSELDVG